MATEETQKTNTPCSCSLCSPLTSTETVTDGTLPVEPDLNALRQARCLPVIKAMLKKIGEVENGVMGDVTIDKVQESFKQVTLDMLQMLLDADMPLRDMDYIKAVAFQPIQAVMADIVASFDVHLRNLERKLLGKGFVDLTAGELDKKLKDIAPKV